MEEGKEQERREGEEFLIGKIPCTAPRGGRGGMETGKGCDLQGRGAFSSLLTPRGSVHISRTGQTEWVVHFPTLLPPRGSEPLFRSWKDKVRAEMTSL